MKSIRLSDAKRTLASIVEDVQGGEPCLITRHGKPEAVVIGYEQWCRLTRSSFAEFPPSALFEDGDIPEWDRGPTRKLDP